MPGKKVSQGSSSNRRRGGLVPTLCNILGTLIVVVVFVLVLPVTAPRLMGYQVYEVVSGSMEPAIPVGSVVYVRPAEELESIEVDDVIAFERAGSVVTHRVVVNRTALGEFVTKGDANDGEDINPVPYDAVIGVVERHFPLLGHVMALYTSTVGKVYLLLTFSCGIMLNILADRLRDQRRARELVAAREALGISETAVPAEDSDKAATRRRSATVRRVLMAILAAVFICSGGVVAYTMHGYSSAERLNEEVSARYTTKLKNPSSGVVPITVDFDALRAENPDVIGWLYCKDTVIDYPVLHSDDNDTYLRRDYHGDYHMPGSIFVDAKNQPDFSDGNTIIYGHHLLTDLMFTCLENWQDQEFYEQHPVMWLLTPEQDYQVILVSGHHLSAYSNMYDLIPDLGDQLNAFLDEATAASDFTPIEGVWANPSNHYVMLSTCAYVFDDARYALHGMLVPVPSAGGKPLQSQS